MGRCRCCCWIGDGLQLRTVRSLPEAKVWYTTGMRVGASDVSVIVGVRKRQCAALGFAARWTWVQWQPGQSACARALQSRKPHGKHAAEPPRFNLLPCIFSARIANVYYLSPFFLCFFGEFHVVGGQPDRSPLRFESVEAALPALRDRGTCIRSPL